MNKALYPIAAIVGIQIVDLLTGSLAVRARDSDCPGYQFGDVNRWAEQQGRALKGEAEKPAYYEMPQSAAPVPQRQALASPEPARIVPFVPAAPVRQPAPMPPAPPTIAVAPQSVEQQAAATDLEIDQEIAQSKGVSLQEYRANVEKYAGDNVPL